MRNFHRCLTFTALSIYLVIGGTTGLCKIWETLAFEHHHHSNAQLSQSDSPDEAHAPRRSGAEAVSECEVPTIPCDNSHKEDGSELTALTPDAPKPIASPFVGPLAAPLLAPQPSIYLLTCRLRAQVLASSALRDSPSALAVRLCRFLV